MDFQQEYDILTSLNSDEILEISFSFKGHKIKIYFYRKENHQFFVLICESRKVSFVKNYCIYFQHGTARISGYWGKYHRYALGLANDSDGKFTEFYSKVKKVIQSITNHSEEFEISYLGLNQGIKKIKNLASNSKYPEDAIYFSHVRRTPISPEQFKIVSDKLGKDIAEYLKRNHLTAVFTSDISRQKTFILPED